MGIWEHVDLNIDWIQSYIPLRSIRASLWTRSDAWGGIEGAWSLVGHQTGSWEILCTTLAFEDSVSFLRRCNSFSEREVACTESRGLNPLEVLMNALFAGPDSHSFTPLLATTSFPPKLRSLTYLGQLIPSSHPHRNCLEHARTNRINTTVRIVHKIVRPAKSIVDRLTAITTRLSFWTATLLRISLHACLPSLIKILLACSQNGSNTQGFTPCNQSLLRLNSTTQASETNLR